MEVNEDNLAEEAGTDVAESTDTANANGTPEAEEISEEEAAELADELDDFDTRTPVTSGYFDPEVGDSVKCVYLGKTTFTNKDGKEIPAVKLLMKDHTLTKNGTKILVEDLGKLEPKTAVEVTKTGEEKGKNGTYYTWKIDKLSKKEE